MTVSEPVAEPRSWFDLIGDWTAGVELPGPLRDLGRTDREDAPATSALRPAPVVLLLVAQAYVAWVASGAGLLARASLSWAAYGRVLAQQLVALAAGMGGSGTAIRTLLDQSAAQLREIGELSVQEARALERTLTRLAREIRELDEATLDEPHRHAKVKR